MFVIIGYVLIIACLLGGFTVAGGHIGVLWQPVEVMIIVGAAVGAFVVGNSMTVLKQTGGALGACFKGAKYTQSLYMETLTLLYLIFAKIRKEGLLALQSDIDEPHNSKLFEQAPAVLHDHHAVEFITDYLRLLSSGNIELNQLENLMDLDIETHHHEGDRPIKSIQNFADGLPAFGIVAAVLGVVHTMESVGIPPAELGKLIAAALVGTFLGILLAYGFVGPLGSLLTQKLDESTKYYQAIKAAFIANLNGYDPMASVEFARKVMYSTERPGFTEMEKHIQAARKAK
ncbi:flagellar motor stator protein MotA [Plasticicumulans acidivorans]|uniref:Chemotaxis protein MotA n=1 Tax=Plasticicumulans acidivorans TaxID=886464 RepID=A0A317MQS2_9GAMM|nr:flagellar motor stator protein MotA [Plasticicumulans acidivorans]PWV58499.1 chemotaxis protein MotA [Plasticicumulans acidivorans]